MRKTFAALVTKCVAMQGPQHRAVLTAKGVVKLALGDSAALMHCDVVALQQKDFAVLASQILIAVLATRVGTAALPTNFAVMRLRREIAVVTHHLVLMCAAKMAQ